jgi:hypothetical protein
MKKLVLTALIANLTLSGCATIVAEDTDQIKITSNKQDQFVAYVGNKKIIVPETVVVERNGENLVVTTEEEGCDANTKVEKSMDTAFLGNLITGGVFGSTTDSVTGKMWDYQSDVTIICK